MVWIFPTLFKSEHNQNSQTITEQGLKEFRLDYNIFKLSINFLMLTLSFYGIELQIRPLRIDKLSNYQELKNQTFLN